MFESLSATLAEMERLYNEQGEAAAEAYASQASDAVRQWTEDLANFMAALTEEDADLIPPEVAREAVRNTRLWLTRLHAAERDLRGMADIADTNRDLYVSALSSPSCRRDSRILRGDGGDVD